METKKACETCKHYGSVELDEFHVHAYRATLRNWCDLHEEPMVRYWDSACPDWEQKSES